MDEAAQTSLFDTVALRKARGAFFTPPELCDFVAEWAVRSPCDRVLEPSCGEAAFLLAMGQRLRALGVTGTAAGQLSGVEIHEPSARQALALLTSEGFDAAITAADFFDLDAEAAYDSVVGNPPYIRYQRFTGLARSKSRRAASEEGVWLSGLASSWAAFVVQAAKFLVQHGRLGLVLPAELLTVKYAAGVRRFLLERFANVRLVLFEKRVFPGVSEEVVLLLAEGCGPTDHFEVCQVRALTDLDATEALSTTWSPVDPGEKWLPALLPTDAAACYAEVTSRGDFSTLRDWGDTFLGMVTGNNRFFTLTLTEAADLGLSERDLLRISPPGSQHLRGLSFSESAWRELAQRGKRVYLFYPDVANSALSDAARRYIEFGEAHGVEKAYKCRVRRPWWRVPRVRIADLFLTYMNHDTPRLCTNQARAPHLNSVHGVKLRPDLREEGMELLPVASLNSITLLGAELVGRAYGGGILKIEPREADRLPLPSPSLLRKAAPKLRAIRPRLASFLRSGDLEGAAEIVDRALLLDTAGLKRPQVRSLRNARALLFDRRMARASK